MTTEIFIDIENTIIDDLFSMNLMHVQADRIRQWLGDYADAKVNLFTWGWKTHEEIDQNIVNWLFNVLEVPAKNRGVVWTKDDSINCVFKNKWVNTTDEIELEDLHIPGAMKRFGMEKPVCFIQQCKDMIGFDTCVDNTDTWQFILIDDLNPQGFVDERRITQLNHNVEMNVMFLNPADL